MELETGGSALVTAWGTEAVHCAVSALSTDSYATSVGVFCVDRHGVPLDSYFSLSYAIGTTLGAGSTAASAGAYVLANSPTAHSYVPKKNSQLNQYPSLPITAERGAPNLGWYSLDFTNPNQIATEHGVGMVTAFSSYGDFGSYGEFDVDLGDRFHADFRCDKRWAATQIRNTWQRS